MKQGLENRIIASGTEDPDALMANPHNWRIHPDEQRSALKSVLNTVGWVQQVVVNQRTGHIVDGHLRVKIAQRNGEIEIPVLYVDLSENEEKIVLATFDSIGGMATTDQDMLDDLIAGIETDDDELDALLASLASQEPDPDEDEREAARERLADRFLVPPFSVLDGRSGYWQDRKRDWVMLGIRSEEGREGDLTFTGGAQPPRVYDRKNAIEKELGQTLSWEEFASRYPEEMAMAGTSIFDPVMCEIAYRWFAPTGGSVLDPFAGGSVRGVVAGMLGYDYTGIDIRPEQVTANRSNWLSIAGLGGLSKPKQMADNTPDLTPVEQHGEIWIKRDDLFSIGGVRGGKVRSCYHLAQGAEGLVTAGSRSSPQVNIVASIAQKLGIPCRVHTPEGELSPEVIAARDKGAEVVQHKAGYNNVIIARAREDAAKTGWREIPFGMECKDAVEMTRLQAANLPKDAARIVMPVGSGMSLAGVLWGMIDNDLAMPVIGVQVGADPTDRLDEYAPKDWRDRVTLIKSALDYHDRGKDSHLAGVKLDPIYESKAAPFVKPGDCFWCVGIRETEARERDTTIEPHWINGDSRNIPDLVDGEVDLVFSCPPYADLEVYSDNPDDLSTLEYDEFVGAYRDIIAKACDKLRANRFAVFVVGEVRGKTNSGAYYNFVQDTISAFTDAGLHYYNEAILVTPCGSLAMRAGKSFAATRKIGKSHQNMLVFAKGIPETLQIEGMISAMTAAFQDQRKLFDLSQKVLVFTKGNPKIAAQEFGEPQIEDPFETIDLDSMMEAHNG